MVGFETLLLGLLIGTHPVQLFVAPGVAAVEVYLDGARVAELSAPPWRFECDLGRTLNSHEIVAVAMDASGNQVGTARRWINMPHPQAEAAILLSTPKGSLQAAIAWADVRGERPIAVHLLLDGRPVPVADPRRIELPACDMRQTHVLSAEVEFLGDRVAQAEAAFGGDLGEAVRTELTAVPILLQAGAPAPSAASLAGFFEKDGRPLRVVAVEQTSADIVLVLDQAIAAELDARRRMANESRASRRAMNDGFWEGRRRFRPLRPPRPGEDALHVLHAVPRETRETNELRALFPVLPAAVLDPGRLFDHLNAIPWAGGVHRQWLSGAVSVAATRAAARNRCRSVALLLGDGGHNAGPFGPAEAREFLADLHVPLEVWSMGEPDSSEGWGSAADVAREATLEKAMKALAERTREQRIVWVDGAHLPRQIRLSAAAGGVRIAGAAEDRLPAMPPAQPRASSAQP